jgi:hypothetical protein
LSTTVGIGTMTPAANEAYSRLTVRAGDAAAVVASIENTGDGETGLILRRTGASAARWNMYIASGSTDLSFYSPSGSNLLVIQDAGNVGIGTTAPSYRLELPNTASGPGQGRANA